MRLLIIFSSLIALSIACKCQTQTTQQAFCAAQWVSHVKVKVRLTKQPLPEGSARKGLNNIRYAVQHINIFKKPSNMTELPTEIFTPSEPPACGLVIDTGKEYLLAGRLEAGALYTVLCGQVLPDNRSESMFENVLEWNKVPSGFGDTLTAIKC